MPPTLALARKARDANTKLLKNAHTTYPAMVKRGGKEVPAVVAYFASKDDAADLPSVLRVGDESVALVVKFSARPRPEGPGG